jgi:hypothetical protein
MGANHDEDATKIEVFMGHLTKTCNLADKDIRTLAWLSCCHRTELDEHSAKFVKMEKRIEDLCRVVNKQTSRMQELQEAVDVNDDIIKNQQEWIAKMRGKECNCGRVDPLLATVAGIVASEDEGLEYTDAEEPSGPSTSLSPLALPGCFPDGESSPLRVIEDDYVVPEVAEERCCGPAADVVDEVLEDDEDLEVENKENNVPIPIPIPGNLRDFVRRRSPHTFKMDPAKPYLLRPGLFSRVVASNRPRASGHRSTNPFQHRFREVAHRRGQQDVVGDGHLSSGKSDTWGAEFGPSAGDYDRERAPGSALYCPGLESSPGVDVGGSGDRHQ